MGGNAIRREEETQYTPPAKSNQSKDLCWIWSLRVRSDPLSRWLSVCAAESEGLSEKSDRVRIESG
jgi:hypothetical protein